MVSSRPTRCESPLDVDIEDTARSGRDRQYGYEIADRIYNQKTFDRNLVIDERTKAGCPESVRVPEGKR